MTSNKKSGGSSNRRSNRGGNHNNNGGNGFGRLASNVGRSLTSRTGLGILAGAGLAAAAVYAVRKYRSTAGEWISEQFEGAEDSASEMTDTLSTGMAGKSGRSTMRRG